MVNSQQGQLGFGKEPFLVRVFLWNLPQTFTVDPVERAFKHGQAEGRPSPEQPCEGLPGGSVRPHRLYRLKEESGI